VKLRDQSGRDLDEVALRAKIEMTISELEKTSKEKQRPIFRELIHSIEVHPTKLRIGVFAPPKDSAPAPESEIQKATGTDGLRLSLSLKSESASVISFDPSRRAGSSTVGNGASGRT
jgi:hypothetical protein